ncbi:MAG: M4 family metallopeptidase [Armatimonadetes bacterium]|nr:M4 family metallopeptidase [Armatimonadota bacterium]
MDHTRPAALAAMSLLAAGTAYADKVPGQVHLDKVFGPGSYNVTRIDRDDLGYTHVRAEQSYRGLPVYGGEAIVHLKSDGSLHYVTDGSIRPKLALKRPQMSTFRLEALARADVVLESGFVPVDVFSSRRMIVRHLGHDRVAQVVEFKGVVANGTRTAPVVFVDAETGRVFAHGDAIKHASGASFYEGTVTLPQALVYNGTTYLENTVYKFGVFDGLYQEFGGARFFSPTGSFTTQNQRSGVDLYLNAFRTVLYFLSAHGYFIVDGSGGPGAYFAINGTKVNTLRAHDVVAVNAFWDPQLNLATFGDGDMPTYGPFTCLDVVAHELTHGVIHATSNLGSLDQTQALEESIADVFGAMTELSVFGDSPAVWLVGEKVVTPYYLGGALRSFDDPESLGGIDHYSEWTLSTEPHDGAGIGNKAFAMVAHGGAVPNEPGQTVTGGIGTRKAELIWFRAVRYGLTLSGRFPDMRRETTQAAIDLYGRGSTEAKWVKKVWDEYLGVPYL